MSKTIKIKRIVEGINAVLIPKNWCYEGWDIPLTLQCRKCNHIWHPIWNNIKRGTGCPECYRISKIKDSKSIIKFIKSKGGVVKKNFKYINAHQTFKIKCKRNHVWTTDWGRISQGRWCPKCNTIQHNKQMQKVVIKKIEEKGGRPLDSKWKYLGNEDKFKVVCNKGHVWESCWRYINSDKWCPYCDDSHKENDFRKVIEKYFGNVFPTKRPKWLKYKNGWPLELDGYCKKLNMAFEYQGKQHYEPTYFLNNKEFKKQQDRDKFKKEVCAKRGIYLIAIPYWMTKAQWKKAVVNAKNRGRDE